jgi:tRNA threonylcarbamoyl adenosine modification protein YeaZ
MKILALEFSSPQRSVAFVDAKPGGPVLFAGEVVRLGGRATPALAMISEALAQAGVEREAVECLAVGLGPGSYHGIRAAIALAQGWQFARATRLLGVSSVECVVAQAHADGLRGSITIVVDAQREEIYVADYQIGAEGWTEVQPLRLAPVKEVQSSTKAGQVLVGPEVTRWFTDGRVVVPRAEALGRLAANRRDFIAGEKLEPIYLRATTFVKAKPPQFTHETSR